MRERLMALPSSSDWPSLPINLLDSILDYLVPMEDYFTFSEVCIEWHYAVRGKLQHLRSNHKRHCRLHQQVPLLMVPPAGNPGDRCCLYDVMKGKSLWEVQSRLLGRWRYEGSSHGWLILVDEDSYEVALLNPLSGKLIHLPPLENPVFVEIPGRECKCSHPYYRRRGVLSNDPDVNRDEFVLMMTCGSFVPSLVFIKSGDEDWTYIKELRDVRDIFYSNGFVYVLDGWGVLFSCDVSNDHKVRRITWPVRKFDFVSYLVESPEGDLLRVIKNEGGFAIYKLQWFSKNPRWEEVTSLGDVALFLGDNHSISVRASDFAGCRPNSMYFCEGRSMSNPSDGSVYVFVFSVDDRTVTSLYPYSRLPLLWISPKFV